MSLLKQKKKKLPIKSSETSRIFKSEKSLRDYITDCKKLSYEETLWLFRKRIDFRTDKDIKSLIESNLAMVYSIAASFMRSGNENSGHENSLDFMSLFNAGILGLNVAIERFDSNRNTKFSTYAYPWVSAYIRNELKSQRYQIDTYNYKNLKFAEISEFQPCNNDFFAEINYNDVLGCIKEILTDDEYDLFEQYFINSITITEIARVHNCKQPSIRSKINSIKNKLKTKLKKLLN